MFGRKKIAMIVAEFLGAGTLSVAVFSMARFTGIISLFPAAAAGLTAGLMVLVIGEVSGAHINPAVTYGLWTVRKIGTAQAVVYICAQMLGGVGAYFLLKYLTAGSQFPIVDIAGTNIVAKVIIAEAIGTFVFIFGVASAVYQKYEGLQKAITIGTSLTLGILIASIFSNGVLNPAVAYGIHSFNVSYVLGPLIGAAVATNVYSLLFVEQTSKTGAIKRLLRTSRSTTKSKATTKRKKKK